MRIFVPVVPVVTGNSSITLTCAGTGGYVGKLERDYVAGIDAALKDERSYPGNLLVEICERQFARSVHKTNGLAVLPDGPGKYSSIVRSRQWPVDR